MTSPAPYRVLITGSRTWTNHTPIHHALTQLHQDHPDLIVISGACKQGADAIAERWAALNLVPVERHPAQWATQGRGAGFRRNLEMVQRMVEAGPEQGICLAFIRDGSRGATHCANAAEKAGITVRKWTQ